MRRSSADPWLLGSGLALSLALLVSPMAPCIDWPEHLALAEQLRRLWTGDPTAHSLYSLNVATHNGGIHFVLAALGQLLGVEAAGRLVVASYPALLLLSARRFFRDLGVEEERAILLVPAVLSFSFGWGFMNFCFAGALALVVAGTYVRALGDAGGWARWALPALSSLLGVVHVMGMLLASVLALALGAEALARRRAPWRRVVGAGALLAPGVAFDGWVSLSHVAARADAYASFPAGFERAGLLHKLLYLGAHVAGLWGTYADTALAWLLLVVLVSGAVIGVARAGTTWVAPLGVALVAYFAIPHVWMGTHLVYQRAALFVVVGLVALPRTLPSWVRRAAPALAASTALVAVAHLAWFAWETREVRRVVAAVPRGARLTTVAEPPRARSVRTAVLAHVGALSVPRGAADDAFSFGRFMSLPIVYRAGATEQAPSPSWEQAAGPYVADSRLARRFPVVVARLHEGESVDAARARLFGARRVTLLGHAGAWTLWDSGDPPP